MELRIWETASNCGALIERLLYHTGCTISTMPSTLPYLTLLVPVPERWELPELA